MFVYYKGIESDLVSSHKSAVSVVVLVLLVWVIRFDLVFGSPVVLNPAEDGQVLLISYFFQLCGVIRTGRVQINAVSAIGAVSNSGNNVSC